MCLVSYDSVKSEVVSATNFTSPSQVRMLIACIHTYIHTLHTLMDPHPFKYTYILYDTF